MDLSIIVDRVIDNLHGITQSYLDEKFVRNDARRAYSFVNFYLPADSDATDDQVYDAVEALTTFYSYVTWTTLVEPELGYLPAANMNKAAMLRSTAKGMIQMLTSFPLTDELTIDMKVMSKRTVCCFGLTKSVADPI
ncbi:MAG: hypothetical protein M0R80_09945 [Proteobacteria bacterium]|jgi:hypothetical protein|nr:hypothetical protein [Pseudomonadota bacterium]